MHFDLSRILQQFKKKWTEQLDPRVIEQVCRAEGLTWRRRILDPVRTVQLCVLQVLHFNTACSHLRHLSGLKFSVPAFCQARRRVPARVFQTLLERIAQGIEQEGNEVNWFGHRTLLVDGSNFSMPDTPDLQAHFGQSYAQKEGCGFPIGHLLAIFDASTGMVRRVLSSSHRTKDMTRAPEFHPALRCGDVLVGDRMFCSFGHIVTLAQRGVHCVMRMPKHQIVSFRAGRACTRVNHSEKGKPRSKWLKKLGPKDQLVQWPKPKASNRWMSREEFLALPKSIVLRELCYEIRHRGFRSKKIILVTTLTSAEVYSAQALAELYGMRWSIETNFRHLKTTMRMEVLRSTSVDGILKELCVFFIVYNLVRLVMLHGAKQQAVPIDRISFIDALRWLTAAVYAPTRLHLTINPPRPFRVEPRRVKRRPKNYPPLIFPREDSQAWCIKNQ